MTNFLTVKSFLLISASLIFVSISSPLLAIEDIDFWPFYRRETLLDEVRQDYGWPVFHRRMNPEENFLQVRPLFSHGEKNGEESVRNDWLYPLVKTYHSDFMDMSWLMPLFYQHRMGNDDDTNRFYLFLPFIFGGQHWDEDPYFLFFPFGGTLQGHFGRDDIQVVAWPFYVGSQRDENVRKTFLWPFFSTSRGGGESGLRLWPFYRHLRIEERYDELNLMWPFYSRRIPLNESGSENEFYFPFYGWEEGPGISKRTWLWPFFNRLRQDDPQYSHWDAPWPFFARGVGEEQSELRLWPAYRRKTRGDSRRDYEFFWPFGEAHIREGARQTTRRYRFFPLFRRNVILDGEGNVQQEFWQVWPLVSSLNGGEDNTRRFNILSPIPVGKFPTQFDKIYGEFWNLYESGRKEEQYFRRALWGLFSIKGDAESRRTRMWIFWDYQRGNDAKQFRLLKGLFRYSREGDRKELGFFYFPSLIRWGE